MGKKLLLISKTKKIRSVLSTLFLQLYITRKLIKTILEDLHNTRNFLDNKGECKEPTTIDDIPDFEKLHDIAIAVYKIEENGKIIVPLYMTKIRDVDPIKLLLIEEDSEKESEHEEDSDSEIRFDNDHAFL